MSPGSTSTTYSRGTSRWLGNLQLITACGIVAFWVYFFGVENRRPDADPVYLAFERSFPVPDLLWLTPLLVSGGWLMRRGRPGGIRCSIAAGGALVFLGLLDAAFNVQQSRYTLSLADGVLNGFINLACVVIGVILMTVTWRVHAERLGRAAALRSDEDAIARVGAHDEPARTTPARDSAYAGRARRRLAGRHVAITGGSSGIGLATAKKLAELGAHVAILARDRVRLDSAAVAIDAVKHGSALPCLALTCDVANADQVARAFETMARADRLPEILINSAGDAVPGYFEQQPVEVFERQMRINYLGTLHTVKQALPAMTARGDGHIVNVSSVAGFLGVFGYAGYAASKFAVCGLSEALRGELRPRGIAVSVVCPPDTDTPQLRREAETRPAETKAIGGTVKVMSAEQVADAIIRGIARRRFFIVPGLESKLVRVMVGVARPLVHWVMDRKVAAVAGTAGVAGANGASPTSDEDD